MSMTRRKAGGRTDANHVAVVDALRAVGVLVQSLGACGLGVPDLLCAVPESTFLIEVKQAGEKLTPDQKKWHAAWPYRVHIAYSPAQAVEIAQFYRGKQTRAA